MTRPDGRLAPLMARAVDRFSLDLTGMTVLTEAATGAFASTAVMAALAGADRVLAVGGDSPWGPAEMATREVRVLAEECGIGDTVETLTVDPRSLAPEADIVTNLGFVRPIDAEFVARIREGASVSLMFETWEYRPSDVDLEACRRRNVPVLGTDESHPDLKTLRYAGLIALKLLLEEGVEVLDCDVVVVGSDPFGGSVRDVLEALGAKVQQIDPTAGGSLRSPDTEERCRAADAVVLAEHRSEEHVLGGATGLPPEWIAGGRAVLVHVTGLVEERSLVESGLRKAPPDIVPARRMTRTAAYVGPAPVVNLHAAGLKVGWAMVEGMRRFGDREQAEEFALGCSPASGWAEQ